ncbi:MAG: hypothetical protein JXA68_08185 [Ignavibacteriales bacterium]|nr:hypothetical protein [Ignavibacteriales bacterium]
MVPKNNSMIEFSIVTSRIDENDLFDVVESLDQYVNTEFEYNKSPKEFLPSLDIAVVVSLITGGAAVLSAVIGGLFMLWSKKAEKKSKQPVLIIKLSNKTLNIYNVKELPEAKELEDEDINEIYLGFDNS